MANELVKVEINAEKLALLKRTIFKDATDDELALFKYICEKRQLDPFTRQIYARKQRQKVWNAKTKSYDWEMQCLFITGIDGFRLIAERSKKYAGQVGPFWTDDGVTWVDVWLKSTPPAAAKVGINREGFKDTVWGVARWKSYCPMNDEGKPQALWAKMDDGQLAKCAEALALRKAFPEDLSGLYAPEEMQQAGFDVDVTSSNIEQIEGHDIGALTGEETPRAVEHVEVVLDEAPVIDGDFAEVPGSEMDAAATPAEQEAFKLFIKGRKRPQDIAVIKTVPGWTKLENATKRQIAAAREMLENAK